MKKLLVLAAVAALGALNAKADYLYWQTGPDTSFNGHEIFGYRLMVTDGNIANYLTVTDEFGDSVEALTSDGVYAGDFAYRADLGSEYSMSDYSFYVEILGYDSAIYGSAIGVIGKTETPQSYDQMVADLYILPPRSRDTPEFWTGGTFSAPEPVSTPEPTSGLLLLLGVAGLALKRKRA